jgi:polyhydroxyalkanoate synthase subunit PhaC
VIRPPDVLAGPARERLLGTLDGWRRSRGALLEAAGFGPIETPWREIHRTRWMRLRAYGGAGPVLLLIPAPIKRAYIWDLAPGRSVVRRALAAGFAVHLLEWLDPAGDGACGQGLDLYALRLIEAALDALPGRQALLAGHSLGGTLAAIFAALRPEQVRGLVLIEAPLCFGPSSGSSLAALAAMAGPGPEAMATALDPVPGTLISLLGLAADPVEFLTARWQDALLSSRDPEAAATHLRVLRWTLDELAMPAQLFAEVAGRLCRDDQFRRGTLRIAGRPALPEALRMPILAVLDPRSTMVPPPSVLPIVAPRGTVRWHREATAGSALRHVGALVGRDAQQRLWPEILGWAGEVWRSAGSRARPRR